MHLAFQSKHLPFLFIPNHPVMAAPLKKGEHTAEGLILFSGVLCHRRCENLSVRCLVELIKKVTECLTFDRWRIIGESFRNTSLLGPDF